MSLRLAGRLPGDDRDGLQNEAPRLIDEAHADAEPTVTAVCQLRVRRLIDDLVDDADPRKVIVEIVAIEALTGRAAATARGMLRKSYEQRTGKVPLMAVD